MRKIEENAAGLSESTHKYQEVCQSLWTGMGRIPLHAV